MSVSYGGDVITFSDNSTIGSGWTGFKNRIINGDMRIDQRAAGANVLSTGVSHISCDRWRSVTRPSGGGTVYYQGQLSGERPVGFGNSMRLTVGTPDTSLGTSDYYWVDQTIEGYNIDDLEWGTSNAKTVTVSFWVKSNLVGQYSVGLENADGNMNIAKAYTINQANTWEFKTLTFSGPTSGTFSRINLVGVRVMFGLAYGSDYLTSDGVWTSSNIKGVTGQVNWMATAGNTFYITGVQFEKGSQATSYEHRPYGLELSLCLRYYQDFRNTSSQFGGILANPLTNSSDRAAIQPGIVPMRTTPTIVAYSTGGTSGLLTEFSSGTQKTVSSVNQNGLLMGSGYYQFSSSASNPVYTCATYSAEF